MKNKFLIFVFVMILFSLASISAFDTFINNTNIFVDSGVGIGTMSPSEKLDVNGSMVISGNITPSANNTYSLGSPDLQWKDLYVSSGTIYIGGIPLGVSNGALSFGGENIFTSGNPFAFNNTGGNVTADYFIGDGSQLTNIPAGSLGTTINTTEIEDSTITDADISDSINLTLGQKIVFSLGGFIQNIVSGQLDVNGSVNVTKNVTADYFIGDGSFLTGISSGSLWTNSSGNATFTSGNVGIGTSSPSKSFHLYGASGNTEQIIESANNNAILNIVSDSGNTAPSGVDEDSLIYFYSGQSSTADSEIRYDGSANELKFNKQTLNGNQLVLSSDGRVGIGTSGPGSTFEVSSPATTINAMTINADSLTTGHGLEVSSNSFNTGSRRVLSVVNDHGDSSGTVALYVRQDSAGDIVNILDGSNEVFSILDGGNVGIGNPASLVSKLTVDALGGFTVPTPPTGNVATFTRGGLASIGIIGNEANVVALHLGDQFDYDVGGISYDHSTNKMSFSTNATDNRLVIDNSGNVGIGTTFPTQKFDVNGSVNVTGTYYGDGSGLTNISASALGEGSINTTHILDGTIQADDIATNAINTSHILDGNVTDAKIDSLNWTKLTSVPSGFSDEIDNNTLYYADGIYIYNNGSDFFFLNETKLNSTIDNLILINSTNGVYIYDSGEKIYLNETKLNETINLIGNYSGGEGISITDKEINATLGATINTTEIEDSTITDADINDSTNLTLGQKITFALGGFIQNIISGQLDVNGTLNVSDGLVVEGNFDVSGKTTIDGNVAIGKTSPSARLDVGGDTNIRGNFSASGILSASSSSDTDTIVHDATTSHQGTGDRTFLHTIGSGENRLLVVGVTFEDIVADKFVQGVSYNGVNMTKIGSLTEGTGYSQHSALYYLLESDLPSSGSYNVSVDVSVTPSRYVFVGASSYVNVSQSIGLVDSCTNGTTSDPVSCSLTTHTHNNLLVSVVGNGEQGTYNYSNGTKRWEISVNSEAGAGGDEIVSDVGSHSLSWTHSANVRHALVAGAFAPSGIVGNVNVVGDLNVTGTSYLGDVTLTSDNITVNNILPRDNGTVSIGGNLSVSGDINQHATKRYSLSRPLSATEGETVEIGTFSVDSSSAMINMDIVSVGTSWQVAKRYVIPIRITGAYGWNIVEPTFDIGSYGGRDFQLEVSGNYGVATFRLRRLGSTGNTATAYITADATGGSTNSFVPSNATGSDTAPTSYYGTTLLSINGGTVSVAQYDMTLTSASDINLNAPDGLLFNNVNNVTASTGLYTDSGKRLTSTPPSSGTLGYWDRSGTTISSATAGDILNLSGNVSVSESLTVTGNLNVTGTSYLGDVTLTSDNITVNNILPRDNGGVSIGGNLSADYFIGDGSQLTGISSGIWSNVSGVATYEGDVKVESLTVGVNKLGDWSSGSSVSSQTWNDVTYGNGTFVGVSQDSGIVMYSTDGITWQNSSVPNKQWRDVTYGNGTFVAVAYNGGDTESVMTSTNGINWTFQPDAVSDGWWTVCYGNGRFVAGAALSGAGNRIMYSTNNGVNWSLASTSTFDGIHKYGCTHGAGKFVIVGTNGLILTSTDGDTWTNQTSPSSNTWQGVAYGNNKFVATATSGTNRVITSSDATTWANQTSVNESVAWGDIAYGSGLFVVVGGSPSESSVDKIMYSSDGATWTAQDSPVAAAWSGVAYGDERFAAISTSTNTMYSNFSISGGSVQINNGTVTVTGDLNVTGISYLGDVGIGTASPQAPLHVNSTSNETVLRLQDADGACLHNPEAGSEIVSCSSDEELKKDIKNASSALEDFEDIEVKDYVVKATGENTTGVIAQEINETHPEMVHVEDGEIFVEQPNPWKLLKAIQELKEMFESLINGNYTVSEEVVFNEDMVGVAVIKVNETEVEIVFEEEYSVSPIVTATPVGLSNFFYGVSEITNKSFKILINEAQEKEVKFNWHAFAQEVEEADKVSLDEINSTKVNETNVTENVKNQTEFNETEDLNITIPDESNDTSETPNATIPINDTNESVDIITNETQDNEKTNKTVDGNITKEVNETVEGFENETKNSENNSDEKDKNSSEEVISEELVEEEPAEGGESGISLITGGIIGTNNQDGFLTKMRGWIENVF